MKVEKDKSIVTFVHFNTHFSTINRSRQKSHEKQIRTQEYQQPKGSNQKSLIMNP